MTGPQLMASVTIDQFFLDEIATGADSASNWTAENIAGWGLVIAGESYMEGKTEGVVHLGQDGGKESRHVGTWKVY